MAKFSDSEKAKIFKAKRPITQQVKLSAHKIHLYLTIINTIVIIYLLFNK
jgi:hypothetical protein